MNLAFSIFYCFLSFSLSLFLSFSLSLFLSPFLPFSFSLFLSTYPSFLLMGLCVMKGTGAEVSCVFEYVCVRVCVCLSVCVACVGSELWVGFVCPLCSDVIGHRRAFTMAAVTKETLSYLSSRETVYSFACACVRVCALAFLC